MKLLLTFKEFLFTLVSYLLLTTVTAQTNIVQLTNFTARDAIVVSEDIYTQERVILTKYDSLYYFVVAGYNSVMELYAYDGNGTSCQQVTNVTVPIQRIVGTFQNKLYFLAGSSFSTQNELYSYDGTTTTATGIYSYTQYSFRVVQNKLIFSGLVLDSNNQRQAAIIEYDGSIIRQLVPLNRSDAINITTDTINDIAYFFYEQPFGSYFLYKYQNSTASLVDSSSYKPSHLITFNNALYFSRHTNTSGLFTVLHRYDGTQIDTITIENGLGGAPLFMTEEDGKLYFMALSSKRNVQYYNIYEYRNGQTVKMSNYQIPLNKLQTLRPERKQWIAANNGQLLFPGGLNNDLELVQKDSVETFMDLNTSYSSDPKRIFEYNNRFYYVAKSSQTTVNGYELYEYDGNTHQNLTANINPTGASEPEYFQKIGDEIYFAAYTDANVMTGRAIQLFRMKATPFVGIQKIATVQDLQVYPNPTTGMLTLQTAAQVEAVYLYNLAGKLILSPTVNNIDISSLASGVYIVQVKTDKGLLHKKVVKQ